MPHPTLLVFDVNGTLSDLSPIGERFAEVGTPRELAEAWFAGVLRDGIALAAVGDSARFTDIARNLARTLLAAHGADRDPDAAARHVMDAFGTLDVHPDVPDGVRALAGLGMRLVTLSNGSVDIAEGLLARAGVDREFARLLSVEQAGCWKPARAAYEYALTACGSGQSEAMLVAAHPWDCEGAHRAGMATAWINRDGATWPGHFHPPDVEASSLLELATRLG